MTAPYETLLRTQFGCMALSSEKNPPASAGEKGTEDGGKLGFLSEKQKNEDRNVLIIAEKSIDKMGGVV